MTKLSDLYGLQETDLEIDGRRAALVEIEGLIGDTEELQSARVEVESSQEVAQEVRKKVRAAERQVEDMTTKIEPIEKKLYGGSIRNPKELSDLQEDVRSLQARKRQLEDQLLEAMSELEDAEGTLTAARDALSALDASWQAEQARLSQEQATLTAELAALEERRREQAQLIDRASLALYDALRAAHQGRAVAKVERGMCQGCRISLPMTLLQKARSGGEALVQCSSCERILYVS
jgi:predicted  nucleic acid-binding Zn-ribbon protein